LSAVHTLIMSTDFLAEFDVHLMFLTLGDLSPRLEADDYPSRQFYLTMNDGGHTAGRASNLCGNIPFKGYIYCPEFDGLLNRFRFLHDLLLPPPLFTLSHNIPP